uniref:BAR domain-containing protein n=1 Tax=Wuchereria bancrofti TaxID=6293 RepID=A0A1I8EIU2_WUCBA
MFTIHLFLAHFLSFSSSVLLVIYCVQIETYFKKLLKLPFATTLCPETDLAPIYPSGGVSCWFSTSYSMDFNFKKIASDASSFFSRAKQLTEETFLKAEKTKLDACFENLLQRADKTEEHSKRLLLYGKLSSAKS